MKKAVIGLSGGMDSATLLGLLLEQGYSVTCCSFQYGSKHMIYESVAAKNIVQYYKDKGFNVDFRTFDLELVFLGFDSALLQHGDEIPEGHYKAESMKATVVPGRNLIFASIMAGLAESLNAEVVCLGVHAGDHFIYPDCRPSFMSNLAKTVLASSDGAVNVLTPLLNDTKASILVRGNKIAVPYHLTRTCYKDQELSCGKCGSCVERLEAFSELGIKDPIKYELK